MFISEWSKFDWFALGLIIGYFWHPLWNAGKKIIEEAKIAKEEWRKDNRNG
jgi:hypothetical protein